MDPVNARRIFTEMYTRFITSLKNTFPELESKLTNAQFIASLGVHVTQFWMTVRENGERIKLRDDSLLTDSHFTVVPGVSIAGFWGEVDGATRVAIWKYLANLYKLAEIVSSSAGGGGLPSAREAAEFDVEVDAGPVERILDVANMAFGLGGGAGADAGDISAGSAIGCPSEGIDVTNIGPVVDSIMNAAGLGDLHLGDDVTRFQESIRGLVEDASGAEGGKASEKIEFPDELRQTRLFKLIEELSATIKPSDFGLSGESLDDLSSQEILAHFKQMFTDDREKLMKILKRVMQSVFERFKSGAISQEQIMEDAGKFLEFVEHNEALSKIAAPLRNIVDKFMDRIRTFRPPPEQLARTTIRERLQRRIEKRNAAKRKEAGK